MTAWRFRDLHIIKPVKCFLFAPVSGRDIPPVYKPFLNVSFLILVNRVGALKIYCGHKTSWATNDDLDDFIVIAMESKVFNLSGTTPLICCHLTSIWITCLTVQLKQVLRSVTLPKPLIESLPFSDNVRIEVKKPRYEDIKERGNPSFICLILFRVFSCLKLKWTSHVKLTDNQKRLLFDCALIKI